MQNIAQDFINLVQPNDGPGLPAVQQAIRGATWLGPDPRSEMARQGHRCLVPESWVGPEEAEM
eukprot:13199436-Alexandrium_andersonii.AAC.1